jgi:hypothetical protein
MRCTLQLAFRLALQLADGADQLVQRSDAELNGKSV